MSLIFFDTETTGTETFFDQILQFAAVRTDADFNELDRIDIRCRLLPHVVPAPGAITVNKLKVSQLIDPSFPSHYEMVRAVRAKLLSWSPALFVGWNSIKFDEALVRQALYKTLHNPYLTNAGGNTRSDVMRIVQACSIYAPDALAFPKDSNGQLQFKLETVAAANGFSIKNAHDAMGDVQATIYLSKLLAERAAQIWSCFMRFSTKAAVVDYISNERIFCLSDVYFGRPYSYLVTTIGQNQANTAEWYVYNLEVNPESLMPLSKQQLMVRLDQSKKPIRKLKSNAAPMLFSSDEAPETCAGIEHGPDELERRCVFLENNTKLRDRIVAAFEAIQKTYAPSNHVEKQIYDGFPQEADEKLMTEFHDVPWAQRTEIVERFLDSRLRKIGRHLIHTERPDLLEKHIRRDHDLATAKRLLGDGEEIAWVTLPEALNEIEQLVKSAKGAASIFFQEHEQYLRKRHEQALIHVK